jgi:hypothetical protein
MDISSRLRSTKSAVFGVKVAQDPQGLTFTVVHRPCGADPYKHGPACLQVLLASLMVRPCFAKSTSMAGHAGVSVISQLTLRTDYL